jgi:small subunit ribosomal protein S17
MARTLIGTVASDKPDKTIVVSVQTRKTHALYKKQFTVTERFMAHDEKNEAKQGDKVAIVEGRPLSAKKRYVLDRIIERPAIREEESVEAVTVMEDPAPKEAPKPKPKAAAKKAEAKEEPKADSKEEEPEEKQ